MSEIHKSSLSVITVALMLTCYTMLLGTTIAEASNIESLKSELRENVGDNDNNGNGNALHPADATGPRSLFAASGRRNLRSIYGSIYGLGPKMLQISRSKIPIELDLLVENEDGDRSKRFDDYGHMRFGKRGGEEQFDDYGHMRFGRSV